MKYDVAGNIKSRQWIHGTPRAFFIFLKTQVLSEATAEKNVSQTPPLLCLFMTDEAARHKPRLALYSLLPRIADGGFWRRLAERLFIIHLPRHPQINIFQAFSFIFQVTAKQRSQDFNLRLQGPVHIKIDNPTSINKNL